ncbi:MAG: 16S rRNA (adenine(1518)-N(6)/adenine(1519)-N(6))-dimethyltransferase RsmA [Polyangiaceae bacterium]
MLNDAGLRPKKTFGQNFLVSETVAREIAATCVPMREWGRARVIEIGAGTGALTRWLAERSQSLCAIERDRELVPLLVREFGAVPCVRVVEEDAKNVDLIGLLGPRDERSPRVLCGNLPYAITGPLLRRATECAQHLERVVFMVQDEVAERLRASPATKDYGALTVFVRAVFDVKRIRRVGAAAFFPPPAVTSAVVELLPLEQAHAAETPTFRALVHGAFSARRKTLRNAWTGLARDVDSLVRAAAEARVDLSARGETLDVQDFAQMAAAIDADVNPNVAR